MGDMGDTFRAMRKAGQEKRAANRRHSPEILEAEGIPFTTHNGGAHLIVAERADFWPGTGKWVIRDGGKKGHGVRNLVKELV